MVETNVKETVSKDYNKLAHEYGVSPKGAEALDKRFASLEQGNKQASSNAPGTQNF
jgi:hypothetical protein